MSARCPNCRRRKASPNGGPCRKCLRGRKVLPEPTTAIQGTAEKIEVLRQRVAKGQALWNPMDGKG